MIVIALVLPALARAEGWTPMSTVGAPVATEGAPAVWTGTEMIVFGSATTSGAYNPVTNSWRPISTVGAPACCFPVVIWTGTEALLWGGTAQGGGSRYNPTTDTWKAISTVGAPAAAAPAVWTGTEMITWGGETSATSQVNTGGRYNPVTDTWVPTTMTNAPLARSGHQMVWTGSEVLIVGGLYYQLSNNLRYWVFDLSRYRPDTDSWATTTAFAGDGNGLSMNWTGSEAIVWGGSVGGGAYYNRGYRYSPSTAKATSTSLTGAPSARAGHAAFWTGTQLLIWGGSTQGRLTPPVYYPNGGRYSPGTDSWTPVSLTGAPEARSGPTTVWTGSEMIVWSGRCYSTPDCTATFLRDGARYDPSTRPALSVAPPQVAEGNAGTTLLAFTLTLAAASETNVTLVYATSDGTATAGSDYAATSGVVTFYPGQTTRTILVPVQGDTDDTEGDETVTLTFSNVIGAALSSPTATGTIVNDDPASAASLMNVYRLYADNLNFEHLYTTDLNEYNTLGAGYDNARHVGWLREGIAFKALSSGGAYGGAYGIPMFRLYNTLSLQHHWTTDANEAATLAGFKDWAYEGIVGHILPQPTSVPGAIPLFRLWDGGWLHLWTTDANEKTVLSTQRGWTYEGVVGNVIP